MPQPSEREIEVFNAALELAAANRVAYLDRACADDPALRRRVEELLRVSEESGDALDSPVAVPGGPGKTVRLGLPPSEKPGDRIGRYKLLQQIGEGGCGVVYMAEQEEPVRRRVALKVIKLGMDTKQVIARFEAERQALALMDHPNIAKVLDAGATETGRPYFVMELVKGIPITRFCDENNLSTVTRLGLFVQVCQAIQHAHQKGIIHRDIKPSNILVADHDGVAVPKVIDFGIAKATTDQRLTDTTMFTAFEQFIGTPAYMSPEQARLSGLDIDTRSDIYSLGVLLYELLTGKTPFEAKRLLEAGLDEIRRIIGEEEPVRPSTRLHTLEAAEQTTVARHRQSDPPKLVHLIRGDLDWIVMKALEKDRGRRYEAANGLAMDIQRHLSNEPIVARPPSSLYRFQKLVRRNKLVFIAASAVAAALIIGLGVSTWLFVKEKAARQRAVAAEKTQSQLRQKAETEASKSRQVAQFLKDMLQSVGPSVALGRDTKMLKEILDKTAERVGKDLTNQPEVEIELRTTLAQTYDELGLFKQEDEMARKSVQIARSRPGKEDRAVAQALGQLGIAHWRLGNYDQAEKFMRESLVMQSRLPDQENLDMAESLNNLALVLMAQGKPVKAETLDREALAMKRRLLGNEHPAVATSLNNLAFHLTRQGKLAEAESSYRESLAMRRKLLGNEHPNVALSLYNLAEVLRRQGKLTEAETMNREALAMRRKLLGNEHPDVAASLNNLAWALSDEGKLAEAETMYREAVAMSRKLLGNEHPNVALSLTSLAHVLDRQGKLAEAETMYREALAMGRKLLGDEHPDVAASFLNLLDMLTRERKFDESEQLFDDILTPAFQSQPESAGLLRARGNLRARTGLWKEAAADFSKVVEYEPENHEACYSLAPLLVQSGDLEAYRRHCERVVARFGGTNDPVIAELMAKVCLMLPWPGADLTTESNWADRAVTVGKNHEYLAFFQFVKGLAEYRQKQFTNAVEWAQKVLAKTGQFSFRDVEACMVLAMAQYRTKQMGEARATLAKGLAIAETKLPKLERGDLGDMWQDWIIAHALMNEARALIEGGSKRGDEIK